MASRVSHASGNRKTHRNPLENKYRLTRLVCIGKDDWNKLFELVNSLKCTYSKRRAKAKRTYGIIQRSYPAQQLRAQMTNWYHGMFHGIKTRNCNEEQLWGDLTREQEVKLKHILKGEFKKIGS